MYVFVLSIFIIISTAIASLLFSSLPISSPYFLFLPFDEFLSYTSLELFSSLYIISFPYVYISLKPFLRVHMNKTHVAFVLLKFWTRGIRITKVLNTRRSYN